MELIQLNNYGTVPSGMPSGDSAHSETAESQIGFLCSSRTISTQQWTLPRLLLECWLWTTCYTWLKSIRTPTSG